MCNKVTSRSRYSELVKCTEFPKNVAKYRLGRLLVSRVDRAGRDLAALRGSGGDLELQE